MNEIEEAIQTTGDAVETPSADVDYYQAENQKLRDDLQMRSHVYEVERLLRIAGARSPDLLAGSVNTRFERDDSGRLANSASTISALRREFPEQFGTTSIDAGAGRGGKPSITKEELSTMTPAEINQLDWAAVRAVLSER